MEAFNAYSMFRAMQLHFKNDDFDYFKYNGKARVTPEAFAIDKVKYNFYKLVRKYKDVESFFLANFVYGDVKWVGDLMTDKAHKNYIRWLKNRDSMQYVFKEDIAKLATFNQDILEVKDGQNPILLTLLYQNQITMETVLVLDIISKPRSFIEDWNERIDDPILWPKMYMKLTKYRPWIHKFELNRFMKAYEEINTPQL